MLDDYRKEEIVSHIAQLLKTPVWIIALIRRLDANEMIESYVCFKDLHDADTDVDKPTYIKMDALLPALVNRHRDVPIKDLIDVLYCVIKEKIKGKSL